MGKEKAGFLSPKAISNRIKAKGLQKLRWYCQMCQKQCRDENGFKCHTMSESHQRQLLLFAESPDKFLDYFSQEFLNGYLELLRRRFGDKRVHCNIVYNEYIQDRDHTHMNSTQWLTLTDFVKWLGREGYCKVDHTEKGWYIQYINRDPETIARQQELEKKKKMDMDDEERQAKYIQEQVERGMQGGGEQASHEATELQRQSEEEKIVLKMGLGGKKPTSSSAPSAESKPSSSKAAENPLQALAAGARKKDVQAVTSKKDGAKKRSALDEIMEEEEKKKAKFTRKDHWLTPGIIVKVITKKLGQKYYKKKAEVLAVKDLYTAVLMLVDSGDKLKVDQTHLETVIPAVGRPVQVVNGTYSGCRAVLEGLDEKNFCVTIRIDSGVSKGRVVEGVKYEDICKIAS
ncbi:PREDICTED: DNA/RNA-binding protein KIN17-like [Branchiostoma belcheri]|uniref:DNA/RNA-binding protein KIN17-like n=1 Tax=Branchiostoma belcheri TaxID=7741 RepID=A0A6P4ZII9_BRABE|nr:PREDICTED: DNA/RNA-binding protein KIN17-like [Branchiostoma belcheri]